MTEGPEIRVGDDERREVDTRLQRAHGEGRLSLEEYEERAAKAWAARTRAELEPLTRDLPPAEPAGRTAALTRPGAGSGLGELARRVGGAAGAIVLVAAAVWGGSQVLTDGVTVFGSRTIGVAPGTTEVHSGVLFGSVRVIVPEGARADLGGFVMFGSTECPSVCTVAADRTVDVGVSGAFASVEVLTPAEAAAAQQDRGRDDADEQDDDD